MALSRCLDILINASCHLHRFLGSAPPPPFFAFLAWPQTVWHQKLYSYPWLFSQDESLGVKFPSQLIDVNSFAIRVKLPHRKANMHQKQISVHNSPQTKNIFKNLTNVMWGNESHCKFYLHLFGVKRESHFKWPQEYLGLMNKHFIGSN